MSKEIDKANLIAELSTIPAIDGSKAKQERRRKIHLELFHDGHVTFGELSDLVDRIKRLQK